MPETKICERTGKTFVVKDQEIKYCERFKAALPTLCPEERMRNLMAFRNEWKLYRRTCDKTDQTIISAYPPGTPFPVYKNEIWWGDSWDGLAYGRDYDFNRPFFEQYAELQKVVPREGTSVFNSENCEYNSHIRFSKNCYLNSLIVKCEDVHYSYWVVGDHQVLDSAWTNNSTLCYEGINLESCYECVSLQEAKDCSDCHFSFQLQNCKHCLFSTNLINSEYRVFNRPVTKAEFDQFKSEIFNGSFTSFQKAREKFFELRKNAVHRGLHMINCEGSLGDHLLNCKNCINCFDGQEGEDCVHSISIGDSKDLCSIYSAGWPRSELIFSSVVTRGSTNIGFSFYTWFSSSLRYGDSMSSCQDCIGCIGLKQKRYCILNKQYTLEEYKAMIPKVLAHMTESGEWGQFFPGYLSPYGYNETAAQDFFPLSKEEALSMAFRWSDYEQAVPDLPSSIPASKLPETIQETGDEILSQVILCAETGRPYKIIPSELQFYRRMKLPLPRFHPELRHKNRFRLRNLPFLQKRLCTKCEQEMWTTYDPDAPQKILCEPCYRAHVYG